MSAARARVRKATRAPVIERRMVGGRMAAKAASFDVLMVVVCQRGGAWRRDEA